jgi:hypothetical protein
LQKESGCRVRIGAQDHLVGLAPTTPHIFATGSEHYIQLSQPDLVISAVQLVARRAAAQTRWRLTAARARKAYSRRLFLLSICIPISRSEHQLLKVRHSLRKFDFAFDAPYCTNSSTHLHADKARVDDEKDAK